MRALAATGWPSGWQCGLTEWARRFDSAGVGRFARWSAATLAKEEYILEKASRKEISLGEFVKDRKKLSMLKATTFATSSPCSPQTTPLKTFPKLSYHQAKRM